MSTTYRRSPMRVLWGEGTLDQLPKEMDRVGAHRTLILCGPTVGRHPRLVPRVVDLLGPAVVGVSTHVRSHSPVDSIDAIADMLASTRADSILAIGGGSAFVTARAASIRHGEGVPLDALATRYTDDGRVHSPRLLAPKIPIVSVPTTPTTATGKAGTAVTVAGSGARLAMLDPKTRARTILLDPEYLDSSPPGLVRQASLNAFVMAVEGLCTARSHVFSDSVLVQGLRQFSAILPALGQESIAPHHRMDAALAGLLVGDGTDSAGGGLAAALSHTIGHQYGTHNGAIDAALLPHVLNRIPPQREAVQNIAAGLGCNTDQVVDRLRALLESAGAPAALRDVGVAHDDIGRLADEATKDFAYGRDPKRPPPDAVVDILTAAW